MTSPDPSSGALTNTSLQIHHHNNFSMMNIANATTKNITTTTITSNTTTTSNDEFVLEHQQQLYLSLAVPVLFGVISVVGFVGNLMVIGSVLLNRQMRHTTNLLIIHLALADLLFIVFCVPFTAVSYVITVWPFGDVWCKIYHYMNYVTAITSVYTLVLMSLDRYLAVCHPIHSMDIRSPKNTLLAIWVVIGIISLSLCPLLPNFANFQFTKDHSRCVNVRIMEDPDYHRMFQVCFFAFGFAIPLGLVCLLYGLMLRRLLYGGVKNRRTSGKANQRSKKRITRLVVVVVTTFALCWLPIHIIFLIQSSIRRDNEHEDVDEDEDDDLIFIQIAAQCLAYLNSCINPFLYAFLSEQFRKSFLRLFDRCRSPAVASLPVRIKATKPNIAIAASNVVNTTCITNKQILPMIPMQSFELHLNNNDTTNGARKEAEENDIENLNCVSDMKVCENLKVNLQNGDNAEGISIIACE